VTSENRWTQGGWRSPAGLSSIAAVAGVIATVVAMFMNAGSDPKPAAPSPSDTATYVFVYGTAMPNHLRYQQVEQFVAEATVDSVAGRLFDTNAGYPAATFGAGPDTIKGYLLRLRPDRVQEAMRTFTQMEGGLYHPTTVTTAGGVQATAFEFIGSTEGMAPIPGGVWSGMER
jgi:gamma-glutamylcyclotransferase (GGCT)/AIG2-like uncharacterized protein YtfP